MIFIRVLDWQTKQCWQLPRIGEEDWVRWLIAHGYEIIEQIDIGYVAINLYQADNTSYYAVYCPYFAIFDMEALFVNILTKEELRLFIAKLKRQLECML